MKRIIFLLIGILIFNVACQDEFVEPENSLANFTATKSEKVKTFQSKGHVDAIPNYDLPATTCTPVEYEVVLTGGGWVSGHKNLFGKFVQNESLYERDLCEVNMTPDGPVIYTHANVELTRSNGDKIFVESHSWVNPVTGDVSGYNIIKDGTGKFEGAYGESEMLNGKFDPETGITSWDEDGYINMVLKDE